MAGVVDLLARYPQWVADNILNPAIGLPAKCEFLPSIKQIREACEAEFATYRYAAQWQLAATEQLLQLSGPKVERPTYDELKAKHGDNWGLKSLEPERDEQKLRRKERVEHANRVTFERECEAAGMPKNSTVSPTLYRMLHPDDEAPPDVQEHAA